MTIISADVKFVYRVSGTYNLITLYKDGGDFILLNENDVIPLYYQLKEKLKEKMKDGSWVENQRVPSERELMDQFKVSRATARKALTELMVEGLIVRKQGVGTFVAKSKVLQNLLGELSFAQQALNQGLTPESQVIYAGLEPSSDRFQSIFKHQRNFKIIRVRLANKEPLILETLFIPEYIAPNLLEQDLETIAVFQFLERECKLDFTHSTLDIEPIIANDFEARYLMIEIGKPALALERIIFSEDKACVIQKRIMRGDRGKFFFTLGEKFKKDEFILRLKFEQP
ncbi:MAG: GntR family transcriptional regulator [Bacillota bacterium]